MASMINGRKVDVHILYRSKFNDRKVWTKEQCSIEGTEATLKHPRGDVYVMEVSERDAPSRIVLEIDFRKVKTYTMRARCWHEVKYDGRLIALHFKDDETFDDFYTTLERVLRVYKKYTKPKNGESFLREVEMFQVTQLKPVEGGRRGRAVSLGTTEEEESPSSSGTVHSRKTPVTNPSRSLDIFERERRPRLPDLVENAKPAKKTPPSTLQKAKNKPSEAAGTGAIFHRPLPKTPFNSKPQRTPPPPTPPPRMSAGFQQSIEPEYHTVRPETLVRTSDEESNGDRPNYLAYARNGSSDDEDDEAFADLPLPPLPPIEMRCSSTDSSASESTAEPPRAYNSWQKKPKPSNNNDEVSDSRSPPRAPQHETPNFCEHHRPTTSNALPANRDKRPLTNQLAKIKKIIQIPKTRDNDPQRDQVCPHHGPRISQPSPPPTSPPVQPSQTTNSSIYGMAMHWDCVRCTLRNDFCKLTCKACGWTRTDAWGCSACAIVYSNDLVSCFTCDVWRCRDCTAINKGKHNETTRCPVCGDWKIHTDA